MARIKVEKKNSTHTIFIIGEFEYRLVFSIFRHFSFCFSAFFFCAFPFVHLHDWTEALEMTILSAIHENVLYNKIVQFGERV